MLDPATETVNAARDAVAAADRAEDKIVQTEESIFNVEKGAEILNKLGEAYQGLDRNRAGGLIDRFIGGVANLFGGLREIAKRADETSAKDIKDRILP